MRNLLLALSALAVFGFVAPVSTPTTAEEKVVIKERRGATSSPRVFRQNGKVVLTRAYGHLDWSKPVRDHMPELRVSDPVATERVNVLDLLRHRTGFAAT
jgi:hypothetical protein